MRSIATAIRREDHFAPFVVQALVFLLFLALVASQAFAGVLPVADGGGADGAVRYGRLPFHFTPSRGQSGADVLYEARGDGYTVFLTADAAVLTISGAPGAVVRMEWEGAGPGPVIEPRSPLPGEVYYLAGDEVAWATDLSAFGEVHYRDVYPGVDVVYYGTDRRMLGLDFVLRPGADPGAIRYRLHGAEALALDADGDLLLTVAGRTIRQRAPTAYQTVDGVRVPVASRYVLSGNEVSFDVGAYDASRVLVIEPIIENATFPGVSQKMKLTK